MDELGKTVTDENEKLHHTLCDFKDRTTLANLKLQNELLMLGHQYWRDLEYMEAVLNAELAHVHQCLRPIEGRVNNSNAPFGTNREEMCVFRIMWQIFLMALMALCNPSPNMRPQEPHYMTTLTVQSVPWQQGVDHALASKHRPEDHKAGPYSDTKVYAKPYPNLRKRVHCKCIFAKGISFSYYIYYFSKVHFSEKFILFPQGLIFSTPNIFFAKYFRAEPANNKIVCLYFHLLCCHCHYMTWLYTK